MALKQPFNKIAVEFMVDELNEISVCRNDTQEIVEISAKKLMVYSSRVFVSLRVLS